MACASCVGRVERAIRQVPGVVDVSVNLATERAEVTFQEASADIGGVADAVFKAGSMPGSKTTELSVAGKTCASCVCRVQQALSAVPGVLTDDVNLANQTARITTFATTGDAHNIRAVEQGGNLATIHTQLPL